jgi:capsular exopolysaccharide synthesis family protein
MRTLDRLKQDWVMATEIHKLEARLWHQVQRDGHQVILLTSAVRAEGKSTTTAYLATALGEHPQRRILAMDLDFRAPKLAENLGVPINRGFDEVLNGTCGLDDAIVPTEVPGLDVVSATSIEDEPTVLLKTEGLHASFGKLRQRYDLVLIDAPALIPVADTTMILPFVDGVILVAMAGRTNKSHLIRAREICLAMGTNVLGLVVGNIQEAPSEYRRATLQSRSGGNGSRTIGDGDGWNVS